MLLIRKLNRLVFFYPSPFGGAHKFTKEDELPFEAVNPRGLIEVDFGRIIIFPQEKGKRFFQETFMLETLDCNESGDGLVTKKESMMHKRYGCAFVRVWVCLVYAIGGVMGNCFERFDVNLNRWAAVEEGPRLDSNFSSFNMLDKYIYVLVGSMDRIQITRLDIQKCESEIASPTPPVQ